ncbi:hypothetical protein [Rhodococcus sp. MALMAid1271]|uniref:hypothetical protein n=1 Tax=Rhodococcus sp. MALMAid1271 TaxID=3411744 RepID=UPI003B9EF6BA
MTTTDAFAQYEALICKWMELRAKTGNAEKLARSERTAVEEHYRSTLAEITARSKQFENHERTLHTEVQDALSAIGRQMSMSSIRDIQSLRVAEREVADLRRALEQALLVESSARRSAARAERAARNNAQPKMAVVPRVQALPSTHIPQKKKVVYLSIAIAVAIFCITLIIAL